MENRMQIFQNEEFGRVRTFVTENGVPWFVGKDVADNLGYQNGSRDINRHVAPEDRTKGMVFDGNQRKETILVNESGLYSLILSSKLESAKRFKHWVTSEVLPSIRRHGAYMTDALLEQAAGNADVAAQVVRALSEERNLNKKLAGQLKQAEAQNSGSDSGQAQSAQQSENSSSNAKKGGALTDEQKKQVEELMKANQQSTDTQSNTTQSEQKATQNKGTGATKPW